MNRENLIDLFLDKLVFLTPVHFDRNITTFDLLCAIDEFSFALVN